MLNFQIYRRKSVQIAFLSARLVSGGVDREWGQEKKEKKKRRRNNDAIAGKHPATCDATTRF